MYVYIIFCYYCIEKPCYCCDYYCNKLVIVIIIIIYTFIAMSYRSRLAQVILRTYNNNVGFIFIIFIDSNIVVSDLGSGSN